MKKIFLNFLIISLFLFYGCKGKPGIKPTKINTSKETNAFHKRYNDKNINLIIFTAWKDYREKRYEKAALDFERLITKKYTHYDILFGAGISYMNYYDLKKSIKYFTMTLKENPNHFEALFYRAEVYRSLKNFSLARKDLEKIISLGKISTFYCGMYKKDISNRSDFRIKSEKAREILKSL